MKQLSINNIKTLKKDLNTKADVDQLCEKINEIAIVFNDSMNQIDNIVDKITTKIQGTQKRRTAKKV